MSTRREVLKATLACSAAALTASTLSPSNLWADKPAANTPWLRKTLKVGMIGVKGSLLDKFKVAKEAGFEGVEMNAPGFPVEEAIAAAKESGLIIDGSVGGSHWNVRYTDPDPAVQADAVKRLKQAITETAAVGGETVLVVAGHGKDGTPDEVYTRALKNIGEVIPVAKDNNIQIVIENVWNHFLYDHDGGQDQTVDALAKFVDDFDEPDVVGVQFDIGNHWKYGDIAQWIRTLGPRIMKLDIKGFSRAENKFTKITEGDVDWPAIEKALRDIKFTGWLAAEVGGGDLERLREVSRNMENALHCSQPLVAG
ncbi:sugar phosphate isomerase/epimerase family protein [Stieleria varia]|uniref:Endonuclease 4 n=1 Tax=Stieleria varia TaxID=2528005 RepID=A0A5C6ARP6_9BACT|nr:sugar phosphate isomerase/epimerase family protein [Stieleria varia]TWU02683.1 endonuclease 4 [Stieleria varia]